MFFEWLFKNVKIDVKDALAVVKALDADVDGYISLGELIRILKVMKK